MKTFARVWSLPLALGAALLLPGLARAQAGYPAPANNQEQILQQLMGWFERWDTNHDGFLDGSELAKAFRGPYAKAYEPGPDTAKGPSDYQFLKKCDTDGDGKISREEYQSWATSYAATQAQPQNTGMPFPMPRMMPGMGMAGMGMPGMGMPGMGGYPNNGSNNNGSNNNGSNNNGSNNSNGSGSGSGSGGSARSSGGSGPGGSGKNGTPVGKQTTGKTTSGPSTPSKAQPGKSGSSGTTPSTPSTGSKPGSSSSTGKK